MTTKFNFFTLNRATSYVWIKKTYTFSDIRDHAHCKIILNINKEYFRNYTWEHHFLILNKSTFMHTCGNTRLICWLLTEMYIKQLDDTSYYERYNMFSFVIWKWDPQVTDEYRLTYTWERHFLFLNKSAFMYACENTQLSCQIFSPK